jgi:hypothetical protein
MQQVEVTLIRDHIHKGLLCSAGSVLVLPAHKAKWLVERGVALPKGEILKAIRASIAVPEGTPVKETAPEPSKEVSFKSSYDAEVAVEKDLNEKGASERRHTLSRFGKSRADK